MAEGLELELPQSVQKYFCHVCMREVDVIKPDLTCSTCNNGFIEEVHASEDSGSDESDLDIEAAPSRAEANLYNLMSRTIRQTLLDISFGPRADLVSQWLDREDRGAPGEADSDLDGRMLPILTEAFEEWSLGRQNRLANLGDYALGNEWDAIITQILNETEVTGPPPLPKEQIDAIPVIAVCRAHVDNGIQCTVCMEDFKLREKVKCLPCEHFFHEECIVPWLEMHATCPICRKQMNVDAAPEPTTEAQTTHRNSTRSSRSNSSSESIGESITSSSGSRQSSSSSMSSAPDVGLYSSARRFARHR